MSRKWKELRQKIETELNSFSAYFAEMNQAIEKLAMNANNLTQLTHDL